MKVELLVWLAMSALLQTVDPSTDPVAVANGFRVYAAAGAMGGGIGAAFMLTTDSKAKRAICWFTSTIAGYAGAKPFLKWQKIDIDQDYMFFAGCFLALFAWGFIVILQGLIPALAPTILKLIKQKLPWLFPPEGDKPQ